MNEEIVLQPKQELARPEVGVAEMLKAVVERGVTAENVAAVDRLVGLYERLEAKKAEREFNADFVLLQQEIPSVQADKAVGDGSKVLYTYCSYQEIHRQAQPILTKYGFSVRFSQSQSADGKVTSFCTLMHKGGHSVTNEYTTRSGRGAPGMNETKCDASTSTIAQREAFCDALNIIRRGRDDDARMEGGPITSTQAHELRARVQATGANEVKFLELAGAKTYEEISCAKLQILDELLRRKEAKRAAKPDQAVIDRINQSV